MRDRETLVLTLRTVRHLRPAQLAHRVRLRAQRQAIACAPGAAARLLGRPVGPVPGWPDGFVPLDGRLDGLWPTTDELSGGRITLLGLQASVEDFRCPEALQLWRYHLHYWDWAWGLVQDPDRIRARAVFRRLLTRWRRQTEFGRWDEWSPYVVALRAWSWCGLYDPLIRGTDLERDFVDLLALHAGYLRAHLELDVGGNHLLKDLKALIGLSIFLGDEHGASRAVRRLRVELERQVLADGGHVERAPAYHCQVLADLLDLDRLLGTASPPWLTETVERMRRWLGLVLLPDGSVPLLNDGFPVTSALLALLAPGPAAPDGLTLLADSGLAVLRRGDAHVLADVGLPCPDDLPAHAHADTLGFLAHAGTTRVVSELGTSSYAPGAVRVAERATSGHSTVELDGESSTEVWGAFRAARRARPTVHRAEDDGTTLTLVASHDGYRRLPGRPVHRRSWVLDRRELLVIDEVVGDGAHDLVVRLHGTPTAVVVGSSAPLIQQGVVSAYGWEQRRSADVLVHRTRANLPWTFQVRLSMRGTT